jgi:DNA-binding NtrC family response regulator
MSDDLKVRLLVVDDEQSIRKLCMTIGNTLGYSCTEAESAEAALAKLDADAPDLILTDLKLPTLSGVELLKQAKMILPRAEIAIMTGHGSIESAVDAMKLGAYDYIEKPFRVEKMRLLLQRMAEKVRLVTENEFLRERVSTEDNLDGIIGTSANIQDVLRMVSRLKDTRTPVLISGESGTGDTLPRSAGENTVCRSGLWFACTDADGERTLRLRKGGVHWSDKNEGRVVPGGQRGNDLPG